MSVRSLNAYLTSMDAIKLFSKNIHLIPIESALLQAEHNAKKYI